MLLVAGLDVAPAGMRAWVSDATGRLEELQSRPAPTGDAEARDDACRELLAVVTAERPPLDWLGLSVSGPAPDLASAGGELDPDWALPAQLPVVRSDPERLLVLGAGGQRPDVVTVVLGERRASVWRGGAARRDLPADDARILAAAVEDRGDAIRPVTLTGRAENGDPLPPALLVAAADALAAALGRPVHLDPERDAVVLGAAYVVARAVGAHAHLPGLPEDTRR